MSDYVRRSLICDVFHFLFLYYLEVSFVFNSQSVLLVDVAWLIIIALNC